jgi:hypothetical protein
VANIFKNLLKNALVTVTPFLHSKRFSSGFMVQPDLPYLVVLNDDPLSSDIKIYYIKEGETTLGTDDTLVEISMHVSFFYDFWKIITRYFIYFISM